jgi:hypothetical protein
MPPLLNDDDSAGQVRSDTRSPGASTSTTTIHQQDLDRRQEQKSSAESVRVVSPVGQSDSNHQHRHLVPTAHASPGKSIVKLPRWTSKHHIPSSNRNNNHRRSKNDMAGTPPTRNLMHRPTSSPRPTSDTYVIAYATADLLSLRHLLAPNTLASKETTRTTTSPGPGPTTTSTNTVTYSDSDLQRLRSITCPRNTNAGGPALMSDWDVMFLKHVTTPEIDQSPLLADLLEGQDWLHEQRLLHAAIKNGEYRPVDQFQRMQALCRLYLLEMMCVKL